MNPKWLTEQHFAIVMSHVSRSFIYFFHSEISFLSHRLSNLLIVPSHVKSKPVEHVR